jgi:hypothetical protein
MEKELKAEFHKEFMGKLSKLAEEQHSGKGSSLDIPQWLYTYMPSFIEKVFTVGRELGDLEGRIKGHAKGVADQKAIQKRIEDDLIKLN